ncbi:MAG: ATP-binding cassette domain-containing protein [Oscillospiraceae bacterium]|nr:ATP-binding cassette domain-containing protein [Oscillospiraceae bacterium]
MSLFVDIRKRLGGFQLDVRLEADGGVLGLLGASGCGKSLTLQCIAGILSPDEGKITLDGVTLFDSVAGINLPPQKRRVGYLFQHYALFPNMTVRQNVLCGLHREPEREAKVRKLDEILNRLHLSGLESRRPHELSGGEQQRVALARILVGGPNLLLLDEPFSALDSQLREQLQMEMQTLLARFDKPALLVTHDRDEAYRLCGQIALINQGRIVTQQETKTLFADPGSRQAASMTGCKNIVVAQKTGEYEVTVPDWGVRLVTAVPLRDGLCAIGVRANHFDAAETQNRHPIIQTGQMEEPFSYMLQMRYANQSAHTPDIWWRVPKVDMTGLPEAVGIAPEFVLPLYE